ncbi:MAG: hypothetical protein ACOZE5_12760 [Verrucomicrobiota bacterium]
MNTGLLRTLSLLVMLLLAAGCASPVRYPAAGEFLGDKIVTTVDSPEAAYYLEHTLAGRRNNPALDAEIERLHREAAADRLPNRAELAAIAGKFSTDFAALFFADRVAREKGNAAFQARFKHHFDHPADADPVLAEGCGRYVVLFAPGWDYRANGHVTGADLRRPRELVAALGLDCRQIAYDPNGAVEANARDIRVAVEEAAASGKQVVIVGASSAGPAIHVALSGFAERGATAPAAWINLGGILQGSPLLEAAAKPPQSLLFKTYLWFKGWDRRAVESMNATRSRARFARLKLPESTLVVNYVGLSLSGSLSKYSRGKYPLLRSEGPNDGLTPLADIIAPGGLTLIAPTSDHFLAEDPLIDRKTVALAKAVITLLEEKRRS